MNEWQARRSGKQDQRPRSGYRGDFNRDRARVIHTAAFRRLQAKTQVLGIGEGDFHRTRLTHSMEVAQIAQGIAGALAHNLGSGQAWSTWLPEQDLIETIALAHDIGHPPFGHGGEVALNFSMRGAGGFEGNGQTLRLLARLEAHTDGYGLDLTRRSLLGVLKYPVPFERVLKTESIPAPPSLTQLKRSDWKPPKCFMATETEIVSWILQPFEAKDREQFVEARPATKEKHGKSKYHGFDTSIMELADDIAYGVHDFEDAIALRMVSRTDWEDAILGVDTAWADSVGLTDIQDCGRLLFVSSGAGRKRAVGGLVNAFIVSVQVAELDMFTHPLLKFQAELKSPAKAFLRKLQDLVSERVIQSPQVQTLEYRGQQLIVRLFEAIASDPARLLKENFRDLYGAVGDESAKLRVICDYIAGMTDEYATRMYERLFVPRHGQFSDRL